MSTNIYKNQKDYYVHRFGKSQVLLYRKQLLVKKLSNSDCKSGPAEFLENGKYGFVFKSNNPRSFKEQFNSMINNKKNIVK